MDDHVLILALLEQEEKNSQFFSLKMRPISLGLDNIGNSCFVNATLLCLFNQVQLRKLFIKIMSQFQNEISGHELFNSLLNLFKVILDNDQEKLQKTHEHFIETFFNSGFRYQMGRQYEASAVFVDLEEKLNNDIDQFTARSKEGLKTMLKKVFWYRMHSSYLCQGNHYFTFSYEFPTLNLYLRGSLSVTQMIKDYFSLNPTAEEEVSFCNFCKKQSTGQRMREIDEFPLTLVLVIERFTLMEVVSSPKSSSLILIA